MSNYLRTYVEEGLINDFELYDSPRALDSTVVGVYTERMSQRVYEDALKLPASQRAELTDLLIESLAKDVPTDIANAQLEEVRRRIRQVEAGEVQLIPGDDALERVRKLLNSTGS
jgi:hypothetical protein